MKKRILMHYAYLLIAATAVTTISMALLIYNMFERRVLEDLRVDAQVVSAMLDSGVEMQKLGGLGDALRDTAAAMLERNNRNQG